MREHGFCFEVATPPLEEPDRLGVDLSPPQRVEAISHFKARSVAAHFGDAVILAGDTLAALGGRVFGKPVDRDGARAILTALSGTTHQVVTGVTLLSARSGERLIRHDTTAVTMKRLTDAEMEAYLDTGAWKGKAGAYGIQDRGDAFIDRLAGSFTNVVGFPMELVTQMLAEWSIDPTPDPPAPT